MGGAEIIVKGTNMDPFTPNNVIMYKYDTPEVTGDDGSTLTPSQEIFVPGLTLSGKLRNATPWYNVI